MSSSLPRRARRAALVLLLVLQGCATLQEILALEQVDFRLDRVSQVELAGVELDRVRSLDDLTLVEAARLGQAVTSGDLPLSFTLHVEAENPADNRTDARLVQMDWTLFLEDRETLSGRVDQEIVMPPGQPTDIPLTLSLNLTEFLEGNAEELLNLALALSGGGGRPVEVALEARPTVQTALGPIQYPRPLTLSRTFGGS